jgi:hypothetical protein
MKDLGVVRRFQCLGGGIHPHIVLLLLKHTQSISSGMRKYFLIIIAHITKRMMIHPKKFKEMLVRQKVAKTAQDTFMGIRFVGSSSQRTHDGL